MLQDDEYEQLVKTPQRIKDLGFVPQKEILTNHLLPYADELDEESTRFLEQVKTNLAKAVMLREMKPACGVWSSRLMKYIRLYGLKFGKEDHITLIKLTYELIVTPDLEPGKVHKFATMFQMLTKKRNLISPDELTLPWRPLYEMGKKIFDRTSLHIGLYHYPSPKRSDKRGGDMLDMVRKFLSGHGLDDALSLFGVNGKDESGLPTSVEGSYISIVKCARPYFEVSATKEILAEILPRIYPWTVETFMVNQLVVFLPVALPPQHAAQGHELWFDELMTLWDTCYNSHCGVWDLITVFAGLAKRNPGAVNWAPHVPKFFTRFLHALNLPVCYKDMQISQQHALDTKQMASWIVWTICPDGVVLKHLRSFLGGVESYLHSANSGRWSYKLRDLLRKLSKEFLNRVRRQNEKRFQESWENQTPEHYKLREEDITEFVNIVFEPTLQAVYSRNGSLDIFSAFQNLAILRPAIVIPPLIERLQTSLTSLTEPHRVTAAMSAVAAVARPLLRGPDAGYPEGPTHVAPLLMAVLPGLDPNDIKKTLVSLHFILIFSWLVPFIDCSSAREHWTDLTEEELLTCESTAQFEDFVLIFFDRLFVIIESSVLEHVRLDTKETDSVRSKTDAAMDIALSSAAKPVLMQCSPKIFEEALRKFKTFATESTFEPNVSGNMVGVLLRVFARVNSEATLAAFVPQLCEELRELLSTEEALHEENPPRDLMYRLVLLMYVVGCNGAVLMRYIPDIMSVLDRALKLRSNFALNRACEVLSYIMMSLSCIELKEWRSSPKDYSAAPEKWLPIREWGHGCLLKDVDFKWYVPRAEEAECAQMLLDKYLKHETNRLRQWLTGEREMCRERRLRSFYILNAVLSCASFLPPPDEEPVQLMDSQVPATSIPFTKGVKYAVTLEGENVRVALTRLLIDVQARMLADKSDDTKGFEMLIQVWERVVVMKGSRNGPGLEARLRSYAALERALDGRGGPEGKHKGAATTRTRMLSANAARLHDDSRIDLVCEAGITPSALKALNALAELSVNTYSTVRMLAQYRLYWMLSHYPYSYRALVPKLAETLVAGGEGDEWHARHKGILFIMLGPRTGPLIAKQDWEVVRTLWPAVLNAPLSEKPSIIRLEQAFSENIRRHFPTINTRLVMSQSSVDVAKLLLSDAQLADPVYAEQVNRAVERETLLFDRAEGLYKELIDELVDVLETPNVQWRRLELAVQMLSYCPSLQTPYPARAVRAIVRALLHDDIVVRRSALRLTHYAFKQRKRKLHKIAVDPYEIAGVPPPQKRIPGYRKDVEWAIWSEDKVPKNEEEWERPWLRGHSYGFYAWPEKIEIAAPASEQDCAKFIPPEEMEQGERYLYEFFNDDANLDRLVSFFTIEEKKGKEIFSLGRYFVLRMVFMQFGPEVSMKLISRAKHHAAQTQEASQRFAAAVAAAAIKAPRYWKWDDANNMYSAALDIINIGFMAMTPETIDDWGMCVSTAFTKMDPLRGAVALKGLLKLCIPEPVRGDSDPHKDTSLNVCARLYALQGVVGSLRWRGAPLAASILEQLEAANYLQHPYQSVREHVGNLLMTIFDTELVFPGGEAGGAPRLAQFLETVQSRLAALYDENGDIVITSAASMAAVPVSTRDDSQEGPVQLTVRMAALATTSADVAGDVTAAADVSDTPPDPAADETPQAADTGKCSGSDSGSRGERRERMDKQIVSEMHSTLLTGDAAPSTSAQRDHARALNLLTTSLRACIGVLVKGPNGSCNAEGCKPAAPYTLVRAACAVAARGATTPQEELPRAAATLLAVLSLAHHTCAAFDRALDVLDDLAAGRSWWARLACLDFAQPLLFYGLPWLCADPDRAVRAEKFTLQLMRDPRLEVRQSAAKLLTGLMHCRALHNEESTIRSLMRSCRSKELVERHCGVLGLCAYVTSRPYSIASGLGNVLTELSRHTSAPDPIPATIRVALADFRRTHQDDWPKHREQLTEDELDLLADLASPPSYCA